jgi:aspartate carbamoyltransferase catalytic subunit
MGKKGLRDIAWTSFVKLPVERKAEFVHEDGRLFHVLYARQFDRPMLDELGHLATRIRTLAKSREGAMHLASLLAHKRAMLYFTQPSTRTFLSFCAACQVLGMPTGEVRDRATSSELKGESNEDSVRTFSSYYDAIIMRSPEQGLAERMAWVLSNTSRPVPIVNAGSGKDQHPTQALLDIYTLQRSFENRGGIEGKTVAFVGDLKRGRTVRSLSTLLINYPGVRQIFVAPDALQAEPDVFAALDASGVPYERTRDMDAAVAAADAVYMTRIQDEWDESKEESARTDTRAFAFTARHLDLLGRDAVVMHPLPRRDELSTDVDGDPRAVYWRQMRNGMWIRVALLATIFGVAEQIDGV